MLEYLFAQRYNPHRAAERGVVFKVGRTTGPTMGVVSGCRAVIQTYQSKLWPVRSIEDTIISCSGTKYFAVKGDSGAPVYDAHGNGQFMVWGGLDPTLVDPEQHVVFATPVQAILHDVEAKLSQLLGHTNVKVTLA